MESFEFYWNFFWSTELDILKDFLRTIQRTPSNLIWFIALFRVFIILEPFEFLRPWKKRQPKLRPQLAVDVFYTVFNTKLMWILFGTAMLSTWVLFSNHALLQFFGITKLRVIELDGLPMWTRFVIMYLFIDLIEYLRHWLTHRVDFLWQFHKVHHSSSELDIWNANRFHFFEFLFGAYYGYFAMALIGFPTHEIYIVSLIAALANVYSHANINLPLGPLKYIFNPQLHIWHHAASVDPRRNVNYGASLAVWDYLLGTAYLPAERPNLKLGFEGADEFPTNLMGQVLHPFKAIAHKIGDRLSTRRRFE